MDKDIIAHIFNFLYYGDICRLKTVSKNWHRAYKLYIDKICNNIYHKIIYRRDGSIMTPDKFNVSIIEHLKMHYCYLLGRNSYILGKVIDHLSVVQDFNIYLPNMVKNNLIDKILNTTITYDDYIKNLTSLNNFIVKDIQLNNICLDSVSEINFRHATMNYKDLQFVKNCKTFKFSNMDISNEDLIYLQNANSVELMHCAKITDLHHLNKVKHINLNVMENINDSSFINLKSCETLCINSNSNITNYFTAPLVNLKELTVSQCCNIDNILLNNVKHLYYIRIYHNKNITDIGIFYLHNVKYVSINGCNNVTKKCLEYLTKCVFVSFWLCNIDETDLKEFKKNNPLIEVKYRGGDASWKIIKI